MTRSKIRQKPPTPNATPTVSALASLAIDVEAVTGSTVDAIRAASRLVLGDDLSVSGPNADDGMAVLTSRGLEALADDLEALGSRALKVRTGGGA